MSGSSMYSLSNSLKPSSKSLVNSPAWLSEFLAFPSSVEVQACWELCRLHNNIGFWVIWLPTAWSIALAYKALPDISATTALYQALLYVPLSFGIKSLIMTIDDVLDYDIDKVVARTKNRAIPRGAITPQRAWLFFVLQVAIGVFIARTVLDDRSLRIVTIVSPIYVIYPTCKRWMSFAPVPLGIMFNIGVFMGWSSLTKGEYIPWNILVPIYVGTCFWTITYETVYQHQDKIDDAKIGIHSPALFLGRSTIPICTCTAIAFIGLLVYGGSLNEQGASFYIGLAVAAVVLLQKLLRTDIDVPEDCKNMFLDTPLVGGIILAGFVTDAVVCRITSGIPF